MSHKPIDRCENGMGSLDLLNAVYTRLRSGWGGNPTHGIETLGSSLEGSYVLLFYTSFERFWVCIFIDLHGDRTFIEFLHACRVHEVNLECLARAFDGGRRPDLRTFQKCQCVHVGSWIQTWNWDELGVLSV